MKILNILQREDLESHYDEQDPDTGIFTLNDMDNVKMNYCTAWNRLEETLTEEQLELYENYRHLKFLYEELALKQEFERGFKLAMKIMVESMS